MLFFLISSLAFAKGPTCGVHGTFFEDGSGSRFKLYFAPHENPDYAERFDKIFDGLNTQVFSETKWWLDSHDADKKIRIRTSYLRILSDLEAGANWVGVEGSSRLRNASEDQSDIQSHLTLLLKNGVPREAAEEAIMIRRGAGEFAIFKYLQKTISKRKIMVIGLDSNFSEHHADQEEIYLKKIIGLQMSGRLSVESFSVINDAVWPKDKNISFFDKVFRIKALKESGYQFSNIPDVHSTVLTFLSYSIESAVAHALRDEHMAKQIITNIRKGYGAGTIGSLHQAGMTNYLNDWCKNGKRFPASKLANY